MEKHPLHLKIPELQKSGEVERAVKKQERLTAEALPNDPNARIDAYMDRLEHIFLNEDERVRTRNLEMLREHIYDAFIIKRTDIPEEYFELQKRIARERGQAVEEIDATTREQMINVIIEDQKKSLDEWINYLTSDDAKYPTWFKYFVFRNITKLSQFDKTLGKFKERTHTTTAPFPDIYREPLAQVCDVYEAVANDNTKLKDPETQALFSRSFPKVYASKIQESLAASMEGKETIRGEWVRYKQGNDRDASRLYASLQGKGTGWCTAGHSTAETQIKSGDFYVYYTYNKDNEPTQPRLAIRMNGGTHIGEVRGILQHQEVEPLMQEVLDEKLKTFGPEADRYTKKSTDMKRLTAIEYATKDNIPLTKDDLRFLYEVDSTIEGFGYQKDPRIAELRKTRNRHEDIRTICNCTPEELTTDFLDITQNTRVFCEDVGDKITIVDFREEKNKAKLPRLIELAQKLKESGSPARPGMSFEGGIVSTTISSELQKSLKSWNTAREAFKNADDGSPSWTYEELKNMPLAPLTSTTLEAYIFSYNLDPKIRKSSDAIVADMDKAGLRPATFTELIALGIIKPEFNKRDEYLVGLGTKATLDGDLCVPLLSWRGDERGLGRNGWADEWSGRSRFVCVRK